MNKNEDDKNYQNKNNELKLLLMHTLSDTMHQSLKQFFYTLGAGLFYNNGALGGLTVYLLALYVNVVSVCMRDSNRGMHFHIYLCFQSKDDNWIFREIK